MGQIAEIWVSIGAKLDNFNKGMSDAEKAMVKVGQSLDKTGAQMQKAGVGMVALGGSMLAMGGIALKGFGDFDAAMTESLAIMGDVSDTMRIDMANAAKEVAKITTFSATQAAEAFYFLASAGLDAKASIAALPAVAKFAQAGMFDMALATEYLVDSQSALGMTIRDDAVKNMENMIRVSDVLVDAANLSNASIQQFAEALTSRAGAALRMVNKDVEEGVAVLSVFADQGIKGAEAGTRLDIVLRDLQTRAIKNADVFKQLGVTVFDSSGDMRNMADIIADLEKLFSGMSDEQKRATLMQMEFQDRSVASILTLIGMSDEIRRYETELRKAGGTTDEISKKQLETLNAQFKLAKNSIELTAMAIGEKLAPIAVDIAKKIQAITQSLVAWTEKHPRLTEGIVKTGMALGGLLTVGGTFLIMAGSMFRAIGSILVVLPTLTALLSKLGLALGKIGLVGASAFIGWKIGELIGELTGLNEKIEGVFSKLIDKMGLYKGSAELADETTDRLAKRQLFLDTASQIAGKQITNLADTFDILREKYKETGTLGNEMLDDWAKKSITADDETKKFAKGQKELAGEVDNTKTALLLAEEQTVAWIEYIKGIGIVTIKDKQTRITELEKVLKDLDGALKKHLITEQDYATATKAARLELSELYASMNAQALPAARDLSAVLSAAVPIFQDVTYGTKTFEEALQDAADQAGVSENTVLRFLYNIRAEFLRTMGIIVPLWEDATEKISIDWQKVADDIAQYWQTGIADMIAATSSFNDFVVNSFNILAAGIGSVIGKEATKALKSLGKMAGPVGEVIGGVVASLVSLGAKLLGIKSDAEKAAEAANKLANEAKYVQSCLSSLGEITEETAKKYLELKEKFGAATAEAMSLASWMKETGITIENFNEYGAKLNTVLDNIANGTVSVALGTKAADEAFAELLKGAQELGLEGSAQIVNFILKAREMGVEIASVTAYVQSELNKIPTALASLVNGFDETGGSIEDMGALALTTFNAMLGSGMSWIETVNAMKEPLAALRDKYKELGITGDEALQRLFKIVGVTEKHKKLFTAIDANKTILDALGNSGWLTQESLTAVTKQATTYYDKLKAAGLSSDDALRAMGPTLQKIQDYAAAYGFKIDDATQALIDNATELGIVKATAKDTNTVMEGGFDRVAKLLERIAEKLGADISDLLDEVGGKADDLGDAGKTIGDKWADAAAEASKAWRKQDWGEGPEFDPGGGTKGKGYQHGGIAWHPQLARVAEVEPEIIMPLREYQQKRVNIQGRVSAGSGAGAGSGLVINYSPQISAMDSQDVYRFMAGKGREALEKIIKENVRGITRIMSTETARY